MITFAIVLLILIAIRILAGLTTGNIRLLDTGLLIFFLMFLGVIGR